MKKTLYALMLLCISYTGFSQNYNIAFRDSLHYNGAMSNICGIVINNTEYALAGWEHGMSIVNVNNPDSIYQVINIPGITSQWREVKTWGNYAYVTTEAGPGLQIVDLSFLPNSAPYHNYTGDGAIATQLQTIHALHIDDGYVYLFGSNINNGNAIICDLADPWNPVYVGQTPGSYIHDGYVRNDTLWAGHIYDGYFAAYDCSNKANPIELNTQGTPGAFTHNYQLTPPNSMETPGLIGKVLFTFKSGSGLNFPRKKSTTSMLFKCQGGRYENPSPTNLKVNTIGMYIYFNSKTPNPFPPFSFVLDVELMSGFRIKSFKLVEDSIKPIWLESVTIKGDWSLEGLEDCVSNYFQMRAY